jgi:hypothetical protein
MCPDKPLQNVSPAQGVANVPFIGAGMPYFVAKKMAFPPKL